MRYYFFFFACNILCATEIPKSLTVFEHLHQMYSGKLLKDERAGFDKVFQEWQEGADSLVSEQKLVAALHTIKDERKRKGRHNIILPTRYQFLKIQIDTMYKMTQYLHSHGFIKIRNKDYYKSARRRAEVFNFIEPEDECRICMVKRKEIRTRCNHEFCERCTLRWSEARRTLQCPMCRSQMFPYGRLQDVEAKLFENPDTYKDIPEGPVKHVRVAKSIKDFKLIRGTYNMAQQEGNKERMKALLKRHELNKETAKFLFEKEKRPFTAS